MSVRKLRNTVIALAVGCFSLGALAATEITAEQAKANNYEKIGVVNVTTKDSAAPMDIKHKLSKLADEKGGKYFVIIAEGGNNQTEASADVYK